MKDVAKEILKQLKKKRSLLKKFERIFAGKRIKACVKKVLLKEFHILTAVVCK